MVAYPLRCPAAHVLAATLILLAAQAERALLLGQEADPNAAIQLPPPDWPAAVAAMRASDPEAALAILDRALGDDEAPLEATVLRATLLTQAGRRADAEAAWRTVIDGAVYMRTFARRAIVTSLADRGLPDEAAPYLDTLVAGDAVRHRDLVLRVAEAHLDAGAPNLAAALYRRVLAGGGRNADTDAARLGLAAAQEAAGDTAAALETLRLAQLRFRTGNAYETASREAARLARSRGEVLPPFAENEYALIVQRLRNASRFPPALAALDAWAAAYPAEPTQERVASERIATLYAQRDNQAAVDACAAFYRRFPSSARTPGIRLIDFRLAIRMRDLDRARPLGLDLWEGRVAGANAQQRGDAAALLAAVLVGRGDVPGGLALYPGLFEAAPTPDDARAMLWRAGVAAVRDGDYERAFTNLHALIDRGPGGNLALAAQYWLGVAHEQNGETDAAIRRFRPLAARYPYHYYGLTARERLAELDAGGAADEAAVQLERIAFPRLSVGRGARARAEYRAAMTLARAGLTGDAAWYLRRLLGRHGGDRGLALLAARASSAARDHASAARVLFASFGGFFSQAATGLPDDFWAIAYPRPFWPTVVGAADAHGSDPVLLVSLMRRESRFDPDARSAVGAVGLLQVMPYTAEALAERAGVAEVVTPAGVDEAILADPRVNVAIAARLNADLLALFDGEHLPVMVSYNAGEDHAGDWWNAARQLRRDFFIDGIPYTETRNFVKEVVANYANYQRIYGEP
ncbi:MAG: transglycosylase SLT domain-containing protein [Acidobacteria bacterium]|nr:transglycosylase SLT domain-containing protein [Acidobacteriota bacterium]